MPKHNNNGVPGGLGEIPEPLEAIQTGVQAVMYLPKLPADIISGVGGGLASMGSEMHSAADRAGTGPVAIVPAAVDYVVAIPKGVLSILRGGISGVDQALSGFQSTIRRLG